jgi:hypothetical protein
VFADVCARALAQTLPMAADYRLLQTAADTLTLHANTSLSVLHACRTHLTTVLDRLDVDVSQLHWILSTDMTPTSFTAKRRRILRSCASP